MTSSSEEIPIAREIEQKKEPYGRNVEIHAIFVRHGDKDMSGQNPETSLSDDGRQKSDEFGLALSQRTLIKAYSSDTDRTKETVTRAQQASPTPEKFPLRIRDELRFHYDPNGALMDMVKRLRAEILGDDFSTLSAAEQQQRVREYERRFQNYYLGLGDQRPDPGTYSPVESASQIARRVDLYIRMTDRLRSDTKADLLNGSHDVLLASFLKEVMLREQDGQRVRGFTSVEEIGGPIDFTESFDVFTRTDDVGVESTTLLFRGHQYAIDMGRLSALVDIAKQLEKIEEEKI